MKTYNSITQGPILKSLIKYFIPLFFGSLVQQSYHFIDAVVVGRYAGVGGLASIDATYNYTRLLVAVFMSISLGSTIVIAQYYGAKKYNKLKDMVHTIIPFSAIGGVILTFAGIVLTPLFTKFMNVPIDIFDRSVAYLRIYFLGVTFSLLFNIATGILRAIGDTKKPFMYLLISSVLNILLDMAFVVGLKWGVTGAATATVLSQIVAAVLLIRHMIKRQDCVKLHITHLKIQMDSLKEVLIVGLPMGGQTAMYVFANMSMQRAINSFGTVGIAAWAISGKLDFIIWLVVDAIGMTVTTFVAQNFGAGNKERIKKSIIYSLGFSIVIVGSISFLLYQYPERLSQIFTDDIHVIGTVKRFMIIIAPGYLLCVISSVLSGAIRGTGDTLKPMIITMVSACAIRIIWVYLNLETDADRIVSGYLVSWGAGVILFSIGMYVWKNQFRVNENQLVDKVG